YVRCGYSATIGSGSRRTSGRGSHQLTSPRTSMRAGTRTIRTTVASISTATASPRPNSLFEFSGASRLDAKTVTMVAAAAVITRAVRASPRVTASSVGAPERPWLGYLAGALWCIEGCAHAADQSLGRGVRSEWRQHQRHCARANDDPWDHHPGSGAGGNSAQPSGQENRSGHGDGRSCCLPCQRRSNYVHAVTLPVAGGASGTLPID